MAQSQIAGKENITDNMEKFSLKVCKYVCIYVDDTFILYMCYIKCPVCIYIYMYVYVN